MAAPDPSDLINLAQLKKPYGIKGWLWVFSHMDNRSDIFAISPWWIKTALGFKPLTVKDWRHQGSGIVAQFDEVPDRTMAETMNGVTIWVAKDSLPAPDADEYYWSDLIGLQVINEQGDILGDITEMFETGAHDVMEVTATSKSLDDELRLIPWHKQTVIAVDLANQTVTVDWPSDY